MSVTGHSDVESGVAYCLGGFEDGSVLVWDTRNTGEELARLKLFSEPGIVINNVATYCRAGKVGGN